MSDQLHFEGAHSLRSSCTGT